MGEYRRVLTRERGQHAQSQFERGTQAGEEVLEEQEGVPPPTCLTVPVRLWSQVHHAPAWVHDKKWRWSRDAKSCVSTAGISP